MAAIEEIQVNVGALRRAPGQLRRRRREHRHPQRHQPVPRLGLLPVPQRRAWSAPRPRARLQPGHLRLHERSAAWLGGPIIKNKLFFFGSFEDDAITQPGTTFTANPGGAAGGRQHDARARVRPRRPELLPEDELQVRDRRLRGLRFRDAAKRFLGEARLQPEQHEQDQPPLHATSTRAPTSCCRAPRSLGFGNRRSNTTASNFQNSNYAILENIRSIIGEWNSIIGSNMSNNLIVGYTKRTRAAAHAGELFPIVDILEGRHDLHVVRLRAVHAEQRAALQQLPVAGQLHVVQRQAHVHLRRQRRALRLRERVLPGLAERLRLQLARDFYTDANGYLANPNRTTSPVTPAPFQVRYNNIPGQEKPIQPLEVWYDGRLRAGRVAGEPAT